MAELKPIKITVDGVDKAVKSMEQLQRELQEVRSELNKIKESSNEAGKSLESIDKGMKFANFRKAVNDAKSAVGTAVAAAVAGGKTMSETVNDVGQSVAGVAQAFGPVGVAAGAAISLITPFVAELFKVSEAEQIVIDNTSGLNQAIGENTAILQFNFDILKDVTSGENELEKAKQAIIDQYPEYFDGIDTEKLTKEDLLSVEKDLIKSSKEFIKQKAKEKTLIALYSKVYEKQAELAANVDGSLFGDTRQLESDLRNLNRQINSIEFNTEAAQRALLGFFDVSLGIEGSWVKTAANIAKFEKTAKDLPQKSGGSGGGIKEVTKDYTQFGETVEEISASIKEGLADPNVSIADLERGMVELQTATNLYLNTIEGANAANDAAAKSIEKLNNANKDLIATQVESQQVQKETTDNLAREIDRSFKLLQSGKTIGDDGISIVSQDPNVTKAELEAFKARAKQIIEAEADTQIALQKIKEEGVKRGIRLGRIEAKEAVIAEETVKIETTKQQLAKNAKEIEKFQKQLDQRKGEEAQKEAQRLAKEREVLQKAILDRQQKAIESIFKQELETSDEATKARLLANKASLDELTGLITRETQASISKIVADVNPVLKEANQTLGANFFTFADDIPQIQEDLIAQALTDGTLSAEQGVALQTAVKVARDAVSQIQAVNAKSNADIANANLKFIQQYIANYQALNEAQIKELTIFLDRQKILTQNAQEQEFSTIEKQVKKRRELRQQQSETELTEIESSRQDALIALQSNFEAEQALRLKVKEDALKQVKANGGDILLAEEELYNERLVLELEFQKKRLGLENQFDALIDKENDGENGKKVKRAVAIVQQVQQFSNSLVDLFNQNSQNIIDGLNEQLDSVEQRTSDALSRIAALEDDLEGKRSGRRDAVLQALEQQREIERQLAEDKIRLQQKIEREEIKIRKREQAAAIANALINGAIAQTNIWATVPKADFGVSTYVLSGISAGITAAQVALIASQKFATGGFTGDGTVADSTGHKVAGVVHNDEWVAPKWMTESPKFSPIIQQLENARTRGFANGGFTSPDYNGLSNAVNPNNTANMERMMQQYMQSAMELSNRPIYTKATEVQSVAQRNNRRRVATTI